MRAGRITIHALMTGVLDAFGLRKLPVGGSDKRKKQPTKEKGADLASHSAYI